MKKVFLVLVSAVMLLSSTAVFAEPKVSLGVKAWQNSWEESFEPLGGTSETWDMGDALMVGPSLNIKFNRVVFLGASYLKSMSDYESKDWYVTGDTVAFERKDIDVTFGLMFGPYFGMFLGYKSIEAPAKYTYAPIAAKDQSIGTWKLKGPGLGILGNIPLGRSAAFYGTLAFMDMEQEFESNTGVSDPGIDLTGISGEVGLAVAFSEVVSANVGFKAQSFSGEDEWGDSYEDEFTGATFGLNFTF